MEERAALTARLEELEEVSAGAVAAAEADAKRAQEEAAAKVEKNNERANEVRCRCCDCSANLQRESFGLLLFVGRNQ